MKLLLIFFYNNIGAYRQRANTERSLTNRQEKNLITYDIKVQRRLLFLNFIFIYIISMYIRTKVTFLIKKKFAPVLIIKKLD